MAKIMQTCMILPDLQKFITTFKILITHCLIYLPKPLIIDKRHCIDNLFNAVHFTIKFLGIFSCLDVNSSSIELSESLSCVKVTNLINWFQAARAQSVAYTHLILLYGYFETIKPFITILWWGGDQQIG
jgi:hypothetical protein